MADPNLGPAVAATQTPFPDETLDLATDSATPLTAAGAGGGGADPSIELNPYNPDKQRDYVRLIVTIGLLLMLGGVIAWSCFESSSWPNHWDQTKEMLQIILPALTGLIGSVIGFYFGSGVNAAKTNAAGGNGAAQ